MENQKGNSMTEQDKQQIMDLFNKFYKDNAGQLVTEWNFECLASRIMRTIDEIYKKDNTVKPNTAKKKDG